MTLILNVYKGIRFIVQVDLNENGGLFLVKKTYIVS